MSLKSIKVFNEFADQKEFGDEFILLESQFEKHVTPTGNKLQFIYFIFQRK